MGNKITRRCSTVDERYTRPQGLYPQRDVDQKKLRRLILDSKLAPCFPGEEETSAESEECPICFLYYPSLNRSKCCSKGVCTECFLQMKSPRAARSTQCPFCKSHNYAVEYRGSKTLEEKGIEAAEEQKFIEAKIRMRKQELLEDEEREQRKEELVRAATPPSTPPTTTTTTTGLVELPESRSSQQVKLPPDVNPKTDLICKVDHEPCTARPSLSLNGACGAHCDASCAKCLMTFRKRRVYDVLDVITPQSGELFQAKPFVGRWRSTWGSHYSPLSRSFPFPSRMPEYHCRHNTTTRILDSPSRPDGQFSNPVVQEDQSVTSRSCEEDLESSWVCEEYGNEESLAPTPQPPPPCSERVMEPAPPQQLQPGLAAPRHRDDEFDFDLEDIMVMEAIWQSIQDQGTRHRYTVSEPPRLSQPEMSDDVVAVSEVVAGPEGGREHHPRMAPGGLASAIAALAERRAVKGDATPPPKQTVDNVTDSPSEPADVELVESDLHAMAASCCSSEDGASTSASLSCIAPVNSPVVTINRCATDADGKVMLPKSFDEQMMLAMALSLADAQSRARREDMSSVFEAPQFS